MVVRAMPPGGPAVAPLAPGLVRRLSLWASRSDAGGVVLNTQNEWLKNRAVRWALALLVDIKAASTASYRGAATISAIGVPRTGTHAGCYHAPLEAWLKDFADDTGKRKIKPYDASMGKQIADSMRPSMGTRSRASPTKIAGAFGVGWCKPNPQAATELLRRPVSRRSAHCSRSLATSRSR